MRLKKLVRSRSCTILTLEESGRRRSSAGCEGEMTSKNKRKRDSSATRRSDPDISNSNGDFGPSSSKKRKNGHNENQGDGGIEVIYRLSDGSEEWSKKLSKSVRCEVGRKLMPPKRSKEDMARSDIQSVQTSLIPLVAGCQASSSTRW